METSLPSNPGARGGWVMTRTMRRMRMRSWLPRMRTWQGTWYVLNPCGPDACLCTVACWFMPPAQCRTEQCVLPGGRTLQPILGWSGAGWVYTRCAQQRRSTTILSLNLLEVTWHPLPANKCIESLLMTLCPDICNQVQCSFLPFDYL